MFFYFAVFLVIAALSILSLRSSSKRLVFAMFIAAFLILIAGLKQPGVDFDSTNYVYFFNSIGEPLDYFTHFSDYYFNEIAYYLLPSILNTIFHAGPVWFFLIIAAIAIPLKFAAIWQLTEFQLLSVLVYFCHFFILHDMTQIRQGVASGILLFSLPEIEKKNLLRFSLLLCFGTLFHYVTIIFFPFFFLNTRKLNKLVFYAILIVPQILFFLKVNIISILVFLKLGILSEKLSTYNELVQAGIFSEINVYNAVVIIQLLFCSFLIWKSDFLQTKNKYAFLLIKIYTIGIGCWLLFYSIPVIAFRTSSFLEIVEIILVPLIIYYIEEKAIAIAIVILFGFELLYIDVIHSALLNPYSTIKLFSYSERHFHMPIDKTSNKEGIAYINQKERHTILLDRKIIYC